MGLKQYKNQHFLKHFFLWFWCATRSRRFLKSFTCVHVPQILAGTASTFSALDLYSFVISARKRPLRSLPPSDVPPVISVCAQVSDDGRQINRTHRGQLADGCVYKCAWPRRMWGVCPECSEPRRDVLTRSSHRTNMPLHLMTRTVTFVRHWLHIRGPISFAGSDVLISSSQMRLKEKERCFSASLFTVISISGSVVQVQAHQHTKQCSDSNSCNWQFGGGDLLYQFGNLAGPGVRASSEEPAERWAAALLCDNKEWFDFIRLQKIHSQLHKQTAMNKKVESGHLWF